MERFKGSLCFNIPFEVYNNNLLKNEYYKKTSDSANNKEQDFGQKKQLVENFSKKDFPEAKPVMICPNGVMREEYQSRFLCHCVSVSKKFLDDKNNGNSALHFFLGKYPITYSYKDINGKKCHFSFELTLTFHSQIEKNKEGEIQAHILLHLPFDNYSADDIIFIKHLFYKEKLKCCINNKVNSLLDWTKEQVQCLNKIINLQKAKNENQKLDTFSELEFDNSLLEIQPIIANSSNTVTDAITYGDAHSAMLYGLITSDEGWRFINPKQASKRMQTKWSLRPFEVFFFLHTNCLILYFDQIGISEKYKKSQLNLFQKYQYINSKGNQSVKYTQYCELSPCIPGVKSMFLFTFQDISFRKMMIMKAQKKADELLQYSNEKRTLRVRELRKHQNSLFKEIEKNVFGAPEMLNLQSILINSFCIPNLIDNLKEKYNRTIILLENENTNTTNKTIRWLTYITIGIGIIQVSISFFSAKDKGWAYLRLSFLILVGCIIIIWGITLLSNNRHFIAMKKYLNKKR